MSDVPLDEADARRKLDTERDRLQGLVAELQSDTRQDEPGSTGDDPSHDQHRVESGSETFEQEKDLAILESLETELAEVEAALRRLDEGTYGVDEVTGDRIDPARLDARPEARTNVDTERGPEPAATASLVAIVRVLLFARAREVAGRRDDSIEAATLGEVLAVARDRYGDEFGEVLDASRVWVNGDEPVSGLATALSAGDEVAILPPVSGGGGE